MKGMSMRRIRKAVIEAWAGMRAWRIAGQGQQSASGAANPGDSQMLLPGIAEPYGWESGMRGALELEEQGDGRA